MALLTSSDRSQNDQKTETNKVIAEYRSNNFRKILTIGGLVLAAFVAFVIATVVGPIHLSPMEMLRGIFSPGQVDETTRTVLWNLRLPASVMAVLIGAGRRRFHRTVRVVSSTWPGTTLPRNISIGER